MKKRILITGGSGLLAVNWAAAIKDKYDVVLALHSRVICLNGVTAEIIPLDSIDSISKAFQQYKPDIVIHTAGLTNVEECEQNPELAKSINTDLAINIATVCDELNVKLVHISTDHLFSGKKQYVTELEPVSPLNNYAKTKSEAETGIVRINKDVLIVRTNFYGWGTTYRHSFSDVIISALRNKKSITLFDDVFYTPIYILNLVEAVHELIDLDEKGVFNIVGDERISKYNFGLEIAKIFKLNQKLIKVGRIVKQDKLVARPTDMSLSNKKACDVLGRNIGGIQEQLLKLAAQEMSNSIQGVRIL